MTARSTNAGFWLSFAGSLALCLFFSLGTQNTPLACGLMSVSFALGVGGLVHVCQSSQTQPLAFTTLLYLVLFYIGPGLIHLAQDRFPFFGMDYSDEVKLRGALTVLVFMVALVSMLLLRRAAGQTNAKETPTVHVIKTKAWVVPALMGLAVLSGFVVGWERLNVSRGELTLALEQQSPAELVLIQVSRSAAFFAFLFALLRLRVQRSATTVLGLVVTLVLFGLTNNPLAMPRYVLGAYVLIAIFALRPIGPLAKFLTVGFACIAQVTIFPLLSDVSRGGGVSAFEFNPVRYLATHGDFDGFQSTLNVVEMTEARGLLWGHQILSAILFWVPRDLYPDKSAGTGGDAAAFVGYPFVNISSPLPAEFYADFGLVGVVALSVVFAVLVAGVDRTYERVSRTQDLFLKFAMATIAGYAFILLRGSLVGVLGPVTFSVALLFALKFLTRFEIR